MLSSPKTPLPKSTSKLEEKSPIVETSPLRSMGFEEGDEHLKPKDDSPPKESKKDEGSVSVPEKKDVVEEESGVAAGPKAPLDFDPGKHEELVEVGKLVLRYNSLGDKATHQERFAALRAIDTAAYQTFAKNPVSEHGTLPFAGALKSLLAQTEDAHAELVEDLRLRTEKGEDGHAPIDTTGMKKGERLQVAQLWQSLVRGKGDVQVDRSNPTFVKETFAGLAKLMQGPLGRALVGKANQKALPDEGEKGEKDEEVVKAPDRHIDILPFEGAPDAGAYDTKHSDMKSTGKAKGKDLSPLELTHAVLGSQREASIGGTQFGFDEGSAAKVRMTPGLKDARALGKMGEEIVTPKFIALGHELGHAVKSKVGAKGSGVGFDALPKGLDKEDYANNPEEYLNVEGVENPLRSEHQISERGSYTKSVPGQRKAGIDKRVKEVDELVFKDERCFGLMDEVSSAVGRFDYTNDDKWPDFAEYVTQTLEKVLRIHKQPVEEPEVKTEAPKKDPPSDKGGDKGGGGFLSGLSNLWGYWKS